MGQGLRKTGAHRGITWTRVHMGAGGLLGQGHTWGRGITWTGVHRGGIT